MKTKEKKIALSIMLFSIFLEGLDVFSILAMFFFQAEELSTLQGVSVGLIILESHKNE